MPTPEPVSWGIANEGTLSINNCDMSCSEFTISCENHVFVWLSGAIRTILDKLGTLHRSHGQEKILTYKRTQPLQCFLHLAVKTKTIQAKKWFWNYYLYYFLLGHHVVMECWRVSQPPTLYFLRFAKVMTSFSLGL